ncbi:TetR family transcriptional regulator [Flexivirga oryzae]|uniref:AcrR family transcriptional regulator n=1 Tax=Flexivirga oryzae TaxID=1794944 RepID=A0A839NAA8_9MICO|nr:TetR family transcriptional regulator [Flexivirga oryzae]MBB2893759.1 AcrR family transcriptional regulator [Flexivirga oryzae]
MATTTSGKRQGRRPGRPDTREGIVDSARKLFAEKGFARSSVRAIAHDAGVDPALITHYFGSKEGLFQATLDLPIRPEEIVERIGDGSAEDLPQRVIETFLGVWEGEDTGPAMLAVLRRGLTDPAQVDLLRQIMTQHVMASPIATFVGRDSEDTRLRISLAMTQLLGVVIARKVLGFAPIAELSRDQLAAFLLPAVTHAFYGDLDVPATTPDNSGGTA